MVEKSVHNFGAVGLDLSKTASNGRFLRSCPPSRPLENSSSLSYLLSMTRGQRIIKALLNKGVSKSEIMRHCAVDYKTVIAWDKNWWSPKGLYKMKNFFDVHRVNSFFSLVCGSSNIHYRTLGFIAFCLLLLCPASSYAENTVNINLSAISQIESSNRPHVIGDKHLKNKAYGLYQIRKPLLTDYNRATKSKFTEKDMLDPKKAERVAYFAFNKYYPSILRHSKKEVTEIALLTCWNMGQGSYLKGKRATDYQRKYLNIVKKLKGVKK